MVTESPAKRREAAPRIALPGLDTGTSKISLFRAANRKTEAVSVLCTFGSRIKNQDQRLKANYSYFKFIPFFF